MRQTGLPLIDTLYRKLIGTINRYHPHTRLEVVEQAFWVAYDAHKSQTRKSGEPFLVHPLNVAIILAGLRLDTETIVAGLLHDVVEDSHFTAKDVAAGFGDEVALLVDGVTKLKNLNYSSKTEEQAENYRKMFFAMSQDIRIIIIKIADRLHNMRTLQFQPPHKQKEVAQETLDIYAPIAHRLGISKMRYELEDLSFKYHDPEAYHDLANKLGLKQNERKARVEEIVNEIRKNLKPLGLKNAKVEGRPKHSYSIHKKMVSQNKQLDEIYDIFAVRVLVNEIQDCYLVLGMLHGTYKPMHGRFKDFIGSPKNNNYQSLHTTLMKPGERSEPFEVQIRTNDMHRVATYGIAAHWRYKSGKAGKPDNEEAKLTWLGQLLEWQRELSDSEEFIDALKADLSPFSQNIYCFTPKGEIKSLPKGSTTLDFAYAIHSAVGHQMVGARVNGTFVGIDHVLESSDQVEIVTSQNQEPREDWLKIAKTNQARSKIQQWFKKQNRSDNVRRGKALLEAAAKALGLDLDELRANDREKEVLERYNHPDFDSLCALVGHGGIRERQVISWLNEVYKRDNPAPVEDVVESLLAAGRTETPTPKSAKNGVIVDGIGDTYVRFSKCCSPVPGDEIVGCVTRGRGVSIHRTDCVNIIRQDEIDRMRRIGVRWNHAVNHGVAYRADLRILCDDQTHMIAYISRMLVEEGLKVKGLSGRSGQKYHKDGMEMSCDVVELIIEVFNRDQFQRIQKRITQHSNAIEIQRFST